MNIIAKTYLENNYCGKCQKQCNNCKKYKSLKKDLYKQLNEFYGIYEIYKDHSALQTAKILNEKFNTTGFNNIFVTKIISKNELKTHSMKDATNLKSTRDKYKATCMEIYGGENVLSKGTSAYEKRNKTVKEKYGCDNVFQNEAVKEKIRKTQFDHFGCMAGAAQEVIEKAKATSRKHFGVDCYWQTDESRQKLHAVMKGNSHWVSKPDCIVQDYLKSKNIDFKIEEAFSKKTENRNWAIVDILVNNVAFEIQGDYWHANPKMYKANDIMSHGRLASEIWQHDKERAKWLKDNFNLRVVFLWQDDILNNFQEVKNIISSVLDLS